MRVEIEEALRGLPRYLSLVAKGEAILLCDHDRPVAELRLVAERPRAPRPIGLAKERLTVPPEFFEPLLDDVVGAFEGRD